MPRPSASRRPTDQCAKPTAPRPPPHRAHAPSASPVALVAPVRPAGPAPPAHQSRNQAYPAIAERLFSIGRPSPAKDNVAAVAATVRYRSRPPPWTPVTSPDPGPAEAVIQRRACETFRPGDDEATSRVPRHTVVGPRTRSLSSLWLPGEASPTTMPLTRARENFPYWYQENHVVEVAF